MKVSEFDPKWRVIFSPHLLFPLTFTENQKHVTLAVRNLSSQPEVACDLYRCSPNLIFLSLLSARGAERSLRRRSFIVERPVRSRETRRREFRLRPRYSGRRACIMYRRFGELCRAGAERGCAKSIDGVRSVCRAFS